MPAPCSPLADEFKMLATVDNATTYSLVNHTAGLDLPVKVVSSVPLLLLQGVSLQIQIQGPNVSYPLLVGLMPILESGNGSTTWGLIIGGSFLQAVRGFDYSNHESQRMRLSAAGWVFCYVHSWVQPCDPAAQCLLNTGLCILCITLILTHVLHSQAGAYNVTILTIPVVTLNATNAPLALWVRAAPVSPVTSVLSVTAPTGAASGGSANVTLALRDAFGEPGMPLLYCLLQKGWG